MGREIERKFLVDPGAWRPDPARGVRFRQGYLSVDPARVVRVRRAGPGGALTVKGLTTGVERAEFEYAIPLADADAMLDTLCLRPLLEKTRYREPWRGRTWEIDVFEGDNAGLIVAEVELAASSDVLELPPWAGKEVSDDPRYFNSNLTQHPFTRWGCGC
jgi:adenylate cyclase